MCRIAGVHTRDPKDIDLAFTALKRACQDECIGAQLWGKGRDRDGGGFAIYTKGRLFTYKTDNPIYEDRGQLPDLSPYAGADIYAIFHGRWGPHIKLPVSIRVGSKETFFTTNATSIGLNSFRDIAANNIGLEINWKTGEAKLKHQNAFRISKSKAKRMPDVRAEYWTMYENTLPGGGRVIMSSTLAVQGLGGTPISQKTSRGAKTYFIKWTFAVAAWKIKEVLKGLHRNPEYKNQPA